MNDLSVKEELENKQMKPLERAEDWLSQVQVTPNRITPLNGLCNHVFLVEQSHAPLRSILRLANYNSKNDLCPLANNAHQVIAFHRDAADLGLSPALLETDEKNGVMWMDFAGQVQPIGISDLPEILPLLTRLHQSQLSWPFHGTEQQKSDPLRVKFLQNLLSSSYIGIAERMLEQESRYKYSELPLIPVHSDLNPDNWVHDGQRWWIIDWDFAGLNFELWDVASMVISHGWSYDFAKNLVTPAQLNHLPWFCCHYALLSRDWHIRRGSDSCIIQNITRLIEQWSQWLK
jgi:thiamine kinase-like enzyme